MFASDREIPAALFKSFSRVQEFYPEPIINSPNLISSFAQSPVLFILINVCSDVQGIQSHARKSIDILNDVLAMKQTMRCSLPPTKRFFALSVSPVNYNALNLDTWGHQHPSLTSKGVTARRYTKLPAG